MQAEVDATQDTEFHDALRAHGIIPPKPPSRSPSPELPSAGEVRTRALKQATVDDLDLELENGLDDEEEKLLEKIRRQRMSQLRAETKKARFGRVYPISRPDYTREVTEASKHDPDAHPDAQRLDDEEQSGTNADKQRQGGTGVVCFLYKDGIDTCRLLAGYLDTLAAKYPATKFVSIVGDQCIPNYPDRNLPTLLIYRNGELHRQIVGLRPEIGLDGMKTKCEDIELLLTAVGAIQRSQVPGAPTHLGAQKPDTIEEGDEEEEEEGNGARQRSIRDSGRQKTQEELDDELDWDL
ncbi:related to phosducin homolog, likely to be involved in regulation of pheromone response [Sporisorium reilianum f. sp. reilianum]|uniref:Related to phosducin homolog, likely to be involved in regulation of pheromone response n=1 Tax=Sporisorium reilianum f. sp. reilianum TaxID=72559 RepID=A0A2N8U7K0_9BASI|nr:related to phosducin homolog, likely to be involved in regulation of pheromone response [Sporisorium reilianum f. sp. reilianum]